MKFLDRQAEIQRLDRAGVLRHIVLAGSWCTLFYQEYFSGGEYVPSLKTRDLDLLVPRPSAVKDQVDVMAATGT